MISDDELTWRRIDERLTEMERRIESRLGAALAARAADTRDAVIDHVRQVEMRLTTEIHGVLDAVKLLVKREDRLERMERRIDELERALAARGS